MSEHWNKIQRAKREVPRAGTEILSCPSQVGGTRAFRTYRAAEGLYPQLYGSGDAQSPHLMWLSLRCRKGQGDVIFAPPKRRRGAFHRLPSSLGRSARWIGAVSDLEPGGTCQERRRFRDRGRWMSAPGDARWRAAHEGPPRIPDCVLRGRAHRGRPGVMKWCATDVCRREASIRDRFLHGGCGGPCFQIRQGVDPVRPRSSDDVDRRELSHRVRISRLWDRAGRAYCAHIRRRGVRDLIYADWLYSREPDGPIPADDWSQPVDRRRRIFPRLTDETVKFLLGSPNTRRMEVESVRGRSISEESEVFAGLQVDECRPRGGFEQSRSWRHPPSDCWSFCMRRGTGLGGRAPSSKFLVNGVGKCGGTIGFYSRGTWIHPSDERVIDV
jgi:hypothetical protein